MQERWIINKVGLVNFWYYDEQEFKTANGRLLLRGANGSGKSVTMQSFIPLLLDGNKSPERLDPFGSRDRKIANYLLGEEEQEDERTGYLYMEFLKKKSGKYLTIGLGLQARRGKPLNSWGFSLTDGRRIGKDFYLYKKIGEKVPYSKTELKNRIGDGGEFYEGQGDYMAMVNKLLYGFETIDEYDELVKLLVQLRTPKLSKEFKPTVIYEIMNNALQPLSDEDLRPMSEAIENMDNIKTQLETLKETKTAADKLKSEYDRYNRYLLLERARGFMEADQRLKAAEKRLADQEELKGEYRQNYQEAEAKLEELKAEQQKFEHKKQELERHDSYRAKQEIEKKETEVAELKERQKLKEENIDQKKRRERQLHHQLREQEDRFVGRERKVSRLLSEMSDQADDFNFHEHAFASEEIAKKPPVEYNFAYLKNEFNRYREQISLGKQKLAEEEKQKREYDRALQELDEARAERQEAARELERVQTLFSETQEEFVEMVYGWEKENSLLKLPSESMVKISRLIHNYGEQAGYDDVIAEIRENLNELESNRHQQIARAESVKDQLEEELRETEAELTNWRQKKDPEPERDDKVSLNRKRLREAGIPFIPLYQAVDFNDELSREEQGIVEEALIDMGLLDALIVPGKYKDELFQMDQGMGDRYIFPAPQIMTHELSYLLKPEELVDSEITQAEIVQALKSIVLNNDETLTYLNDQGEYGIGLIRGKVGRNYQAKYIGIKARERYRQEMISQLEKEIEFINGKIEDQSIHISRLNDQLAILKKEFIGFPPKDDLETGLKMVMTAELDYDNRQKVVEQREVAVAKTYAHLKEISAEVQAVTAKIYLPVNLAVYEEALMVAGDYQELLANLETEHTLLVQNRYQIQGLKDQIEEVLSDLDNLLYDLNRIERKIKEGQEIIKNYQELLARTNYQEIKREIDQCITALRSLPGKIEKKIDERRSFLDKYEAVEENLEKLEEDILTARSEYDLYQLGFEREYQLGYVTKPAKEQELIVVASKIYRELKAEESSNRTRIDYETGLLSKYHDNRQHLAEYNLRADYIFSEDETDSDSDSKYSKVARVNQDDFKRLKIMARIKGKDVNFYILVDFIEESIMENERLLKESDRQLFEDILANTISKKIRAKIYHAEQWVKKMNNLMESMDTSSGLSLSLRWKSKVAETEEQLDTQRLVEILKSEASLLREEDFKALSSHFRSKINEVRKVMEDSGATRTFHAIMRDILDYRKWFEFSLYYQKTNERKKELTNRAFNKFSGGEKAMAMYVPLFSAVYARYENGRADCPRIISLDEAFAGVDSNNIQDMFRLLEELGLNFIINSQVLWGDYETVPSLSICELVRPNNASIVTVIRYTWDGRVRRLVS